MEPSLQKLDYNELHDIRSNISRINRSVLIKVIVVSHCTPSDYSKPCIFRNHTTTTLEVIKRMDLAVTGSCLCI